MRVVECQLASAVLGLALGASEAEARALKTLRQVEPLIAAKCMTAAGAVEALLHQQPYTHEEVGEGKGGGGGRGCSR